MKPVFFYKRKWVSHYSAPRCSALVHRHIRSLGDGGAVGRAHDALAAHDLLDAVRAPAGDARDRKQRREQLVGYAEHTDDEAGVEVDVGADRRREVLALDYEARAVALYAAEIVVVHGHALGLGHFGGVDLEQLGAGVGLGVDGVAEAVDLAGAVARLAVEHLRQVGAHGVVVVRVGHVLLDALYHGLDSGVRAAVQRAFERADRARDGAVGVGAGRGQGAADEGGVVAAAVLGVEDHQNIEQMRLLRRVALVVAEHTQEVLRHGEALLGVMDVEALFVEVVALHGVGVGDYDGEARNQLYRLAEHVLKTGVVGVGVVGVEGVVVVFEFG